MTHRSNAENGTEETASQTAPREGEAEHIKSQRLAKEKEKKREHTRQEASAQADGHESLTAPTVYEIISREGIEEMNRPLTSLWWSGVAAGLGISISLYVMASLRVELGDIPGAHAIEKFGYCFGFLVVVLSRLQLFTENTITPILPMLRHRDRQMFICVGRLWIVVLLANLVGTFLAAALPSIFPIGSEEQNKALLEISLHFAERPFVSVFFSAIPAGFMVAVMVWMLPGSKHFEFWTILIMTYAIAITDTSHVIVGSTELFYALLQGETNVPDALARLLLAGAGNIVGGTGLFAVLAYAQVSEEI